MRKFFRTISKIIPSNLIFKGIGLKTIYPFYHLVTDNPPQHVKNIYKVLAVKEFERDLDYFLKYYNPIDAHTLIKFINKEIVVEKPSFFLSLDDGFKEVKEVIAPILLRKGIPATVFVNPAFVGNMDLMYRCKISLIVERLESSNISNAILAGIALLLSTEKDISKIKKKLFRLKHSQNEVITKIAELLYINFNEYLLTIQPYLSIDDLHDLEKLGFTIGGHGYNHPYFNEINYDEQLSEVMRCMQWIGSNFPDQPKLFAYPFTDYGVSEKLLDRIVNQQNGFCNLSFGTSGIQPEKFQRHLQRIPMENNGISAMRLIESEIIYYLVKKGMGF